MMLEPWIADLTFIDVMIYIAMFLIIDFAFTMVLCWGMYKVYIKDKFKMSELSPQGEESPDTTDAP